MPLPRFTRLPTDEQKRIVDAAHKMFATVGVDRATYADVIASAGISKSSAYNYFDGRDDLLGTVLDKVAGRLRAVLGEWQRQPDAVSFWTEIETATRRLGRHALEHPEDRALIDPAFLLRAQAGFLDWIGTVIDNGIEISVITVACDRDLLIMSTAALIRAGDAWWTQRIKSGLPPPSSEQQWHLVRALWGAEPVPL